jgi:hypothetical protein
MLARAPLRQLALDPLIAEAKRRARQRRVLLAAAVVLVVAAGVGVARVAFASSGSSFAPTRPASSAVQAGGAGFHQATRLVPGVPRVPVPYFGIALYLRNASGETVTLDGVRLLLSPRSPLRQIGTRWSLYRPEVCHPGWSCPLFPLPVLGYGSQGTTVRPYGAVRASPLRVAPGHTAWTQLNFRIVGCTSRSLQEAVSVVKTTIVYTLPNGTRIRQHGPPRPRHTVRRMFPVFASEGAANAWTGALPGSQLAGPVGEITTTPCQR